MIPKVNNVDLLILADNTGQGSYKFKKLIFHKEEQYLLLLQREDFKVLKTRYDNEHLKLIEINNEEYQELRELGLLDVDQPEKDLKTIGEFSVIGIYFNKLENEGSMFVEFKISSIEKPLDILPYIVQTGVNHVFFSE